MRLIRILVLLACCPPALASSEEFGALFPHPANLSSFDIVSGLCAADFNNDGKLDLATAVTAYGNEVEVWLGNGDGSHLQHAVYPMSSPTFLASGDFNDDGNVDLAISTLQNRRLRIMLGQGDGTFVVGNEIGNLTGQAWRVAVGEFNQDNAQDVVLASPAGNLLFAGNGDGTFDTPIAIPGSSRSLAVGDFNEDGLNDLVEPTQILIGDGEFGFAVGEGLVTGLGNDVTQVVARDLNDDGHLDLAIAAASTVSVFLGDGTGSFTLVQSHALAGVRTVLVLDVTTDALPDLVTTSVCTGCPLGIKLLRGLGQGLFAEPVQIYTGDYSIYTTAAGDFNNDGHQDIALADSHESHSGVVLGRGDGTFKTPLSYGEESGAWIDAVADLNLDGRPDLLSARFNKIWIMLATGVGTFEPATIHGLSTTGIAVGEMNGDGIPDIASVSSSSLSLYLGDGTGGFSLDVETPLSGYAELATADLDGDQIDDVVTTAGTPPELSVYLGRSESGFQSLPLVALPSNPTVIALGPIDGDPHIDLLTVSDNGEISVRMGLGDGTFGSGVGTSVVASLCGLVLGDINGDSLLDLAVTLYNSNQIQALTGDGNGDFTLSDVRTVTRLSTHCRPALADVDADDLLDLVVPLWGGAVLFQGQGDATFGSGQPFLTADVAGGDFDLDGRVDLVGSGAVSLNQSGPDSLTFLSDDVTLAWPSVHGARAYTVYRGSLSGLPDSGYGSCISTLDDDDRDPYLIDAQIPASGNGFFYLVGVVDAEGEGDLGSTSSGLPRVPLTACP